jgi:hypothetical protein
MPTIPTSYPVKSKTQDKSRVPISKYPKLNLSIVCIYSIYSLVDLSPKANQVIVTSILQLQLLCTFYHKLVMETFNQVDCRGKGVQQDLLSQYSKMLQILSQPGAASF